MNTARITVLVCALVGSAAMADDKIYRCGSEYMTGITEAQAKTCKLISSESTPAKQAKPATRYNPPNLSGMDVVAVLSPPIEPPPRPAPKELGTYDQWRFDSCMTDAAKSPTARGVDVAAAVCRKRFEQ